MSLFSYIPRYTASQSRRKCTHYTECRGIGAELYLLKISPESSPTDKFSWFYTVPTVKLLDTQPQVRQPPFLLTFNPLFTNKSFDTALLRPSLNVVHFVRD